jgi:hypothetical protein
MSIAEFYIDNCIDPSDPNHMDNFLESLADPAPVYFSGLAVVQRDHGSSWPLNESELDSMGETRGWDKIEGLPAQPPMASYRMQYGDGIIRLNFWLSTGTVGSYLDHPRQGKTQLFRREITMSGAAEIFDNPRQHTGKGYHTKNEEPSNNDNRKRKASSQGGYVRTCARCGKSKPNDQYSNNQRRKGASSKCRSCV